MKYHVIYVSYLRIQILMYVIVCVCVVCVRPESNPYINIPKYIYLSLFVPLLNDTAVQLTTQTILSIVLIVYCLQSVTRSCPVNHSAISQTCYLVSYIAMVKVKFSSDCFYGRQGVGQEEGIKQRGDSRIYLANQ